MNLLMWIEQFDGNLPPPAILKPKPLWTGKQILSLLIPEINLTRFSSTFNKEIEKDHSINLCDTVILIEKGDLLSGIVDKRTAGSASGSLIHLIWMEHGPVEAGNFLSGAQKLVNNWL